MNRLSLAILKRTVSSGVPVIKSMKPRGFVSYSTGRPKAFPTYTGSVAVLMATASGMGTAYAYQQTHYETLEAQKKFIHLVLYYSPKQPTRYFQGRSELIATVEAILQAAAPSEQLDPKDLKDVFLTFFSNEGAVESPKNSSQKLPKTIFVSAAPGYGKTQFGLQILDRQSQKNPDLLQIYVEDMSTTTDLNFKTDRPLLVFIDNVDTPEILEAVLKFRAQQSANVSLMIAGTLDFDPDDSRFDKVIHLEGLDQSAVQEMVLMYCQVNELPTPELTQINQLRERLNGNPILIKSALSELSRYGGYRSISTIVTRLKACDNNPGHLFEVKPDDYAPSLQHRYQEILTRHAQADWEEDLIKSIALNPGIEFQKLLTQFNQLNKDHQLDLTALINKWVALRIMTVDQANHMRLTKDLQDMLVYQTLWKPKQSIQDRVIALESLKHDLTTGAVFDLISSEQIEAFSQNKTEVTMLKATYFLVPCLSTFGSVVVGIFGLGVSLNFLVIPSVGFGVMGVLLTNMAAKFYFKYQLMLEINRLNQDQRRIEDRLKLIQKKEAL